MEMCKAVFAINIRTECLTKRIDICTIQSQRYELLTMFNTNFGKILIAKLKKA